MKYTLFIALLFITFVSCTKTKTNTVTVTKNDTIATTVTAYDTVYDKPTLVGVWSDGVTGNVEPTFTADSVIWSYQTPYQYVASGDSVFVLGANRVVFTQYAYRVSKNNDTLYLTEILISGKPTNMYLRVN